MQLNIIHPTERWQYSRALMEMHHHRKQTFIDRLGWDLPTRGSWLEVDEFDNDRAVYIMTVAGQGGAHLGSVRLLPTTQPHMLSTIFGGLCPDGAPTGENIWEISRFVATPEGADGRNILRVHRLLALGILEFGLANGIERFTFVAETGRMPALLSIGWQVLPLSLPTLCSGSLIEAAEIIVDENCLDHVRRRAGRNGSADAFGAELRTAA